MPKHLRRKEDTAAHDRIVWEWTQPPRACNDMLVMHIKHSDEDKQEGDLLLPILLPKYEQPVVDKVPSKCPQRSLRPQAHWLRGLQAGIHTKTDFVFATFWPVCLMWRKLCTSDTMLTNKRILLLAYVSI